MGQRIDDLIKERSGDIKKRKIAFLDDGLLDDQDIEEEYGFPYK